LEAVSEFYAGLAALESLDTTKLANRKDSGTEKPKVSKADSHFMQAKAGFEAAGRSCAQFKAHFKEEERLALLNRDISGFQNLAEMVGEISKQIASGTIPKMESVHDAMTAINETLIFSKYRAQAHRGMPGHYPTNEVKF
jgi:hypothetical protein